ncbi:MAG: P-loop NTPase fold protein [Candidatus Moranbacteria bacterium]|nr:P-loop NTPase fold protein [Candidatus Moranbacteria bacterium]
MANQGFVKNHELLKEHSKVNDLLGFSDIVASFAKKIDSLPTSSIIALVGPFGSGKSTMINRVMNERGSGEKWIEFDAWKYPDRKDLWEGFILDFSKEISPKDFAETEKKIQGTQNEDKKTLIKTISRIPGFAVLEGINHFFETSPARRVDEIQKILKEQVEKADSNLFIIVEDIDRSGDAGVFFLETLKQFLHSYSFKKKFVVIVPIANENYYKNLESYLKCIDYFDFFQPEKVKLDKFVDEIFRNNLFTGSFNRQDNNKLVWTGANRKSQIISFLEGLFVERVETNMRLLKLIIRKADLIYKNQVDDGLEPDFRVTLCIEAAKYFKIDNKSDRKYFNDFKERGVITRGNIFCSFLFAMLCNALSIYERQFTSGGEEKDFLMQSPRDFKFIERKDNNIQVYPSHPWEFGMFDDDKGFGITKFYIDY